MSPLIQRLLEERGIVDTETFLNPAYESIHDPFLLPDMAVAVDRILKAIKKGEKVAVWHDYDCDGIPGGSLLSDFFMKIGYPARMQVAERNEGYGLNEAGIRMLADEGVSVLITVDCGITDNVEVALAQSLGIDVIVTDHHLPQKQEAAQAGAHLSKKVLGSPVGAETSLAGQTFSRDALPPGVAVINPHRADSEYPEKVLCGTGVAFKLVEGLIQKGDFGLPEGWHKWLLDLVALATVADMVPLTGENRTLVRYGLQVMSKGRRKGLAALLRKERIPAAYVTEDDIGFSIAPKINASSRMESPRLAVELLTTTSDERADELANKLVNLNKARKLEGARVAKEVKHRLEQLPTIGDIIVMGSQEWRPSLLGIAGNNIVETYGKTVCLWGCDGSLIKGSIRSNGKVNVVDLMTGARHVFEDFGGHESSGGFSITAESIHQLPEALEKSYQALTYPVAVGQRIEKVLGSPVGAETSLAGQTISDAHPLGSEISEAGSVCLEEKSGRPQGGEPRTFSKGMPNLPDNHSGLLSLSEVTDRTYDSLRMMAPFGMDNRKPIFRFSNITVDRVLLFGGGKEHVRLALSDDSGADAEAMAFFIGRSSFKNEIEMLSVGDKVTIDATMDRSYFGGRPSLRLRIENLRV